MNATNQNQSHRPSISLATIKNILGKVLKHLLEILIPVIVAIIIWYVLAMVFKFWRLDSVVIFLSFIITLVVVSFAINQLIRWLTRTERGQKTIKAIISSFLLPFIVSVAANTIPVSGNETLLTWWVRQIMGWQEYSFIRDIGTTVINSTSTETKIAGIQTLKTIHTETTFDELFRIFEQDKEILADYSTYGALSEAIASYGKPSRDRLVRVFYKSTGVVHDTPRGTNYDLYNWFFAKAFENLRYQIASEGGDTITTHSQLETLDKAALELRKALMEVQTKRRRYYDPSLSFVLDTLLKMELGEDPEVYSFAKTIAADSTYAEYTRAAAITLFSYLGSKNDFDLLVSYLHSDSEPVLPKSN